MTASSMKNSSETEYVWELMPDYVPPHIKDLPKGEGFSFAKIIKFDWLIVKGLVGFLLGEFVYGIRRLLEGKIKFQPTADFGLAETFKIINQWRRLEDFNYFYKPWSCFEKPRVAETWQTDVEFARQRLYGVNPAFIRKCRPEDLRLDGKFPVAEDLVKGVLPEGSSLAKKMEQHQLYLIDYEILANILTPELEDQLGKYSVSPICLFHVNEQSQLLPLAIRLHQGEGTTDLVQNPILTPQSPSESWLTAKMAVSSADIAYQGIIAHLLNTHLIVETIAVTTLRKLPTSHVIFQMLRPHFFNTLAINEMARGIFLGHKGFFDDTGALGYTGSNELLRRAYTGKGDGYKGEPHLFYQKALPYDLAAREVENLPGYHYRDDARLIWNALHAYVTRILRSTYSSPGDLEKDAALQSWKNELVSQEYGRIQGLLPPEKSDQVTGVLTDLEALADILTNVIFTATAQHSAVNFGQYEYAGWVPNMPFAAYQPFTDVSNQKPPTTSFVQRMPSRVQTIKQMILVDALSMPTPDSSASLLTLPNPFQDSEARNIFDDFQKTTLLEIEQKITARNAQLELPYVRLLPSKIAQSIAI